MNRRFAQITASLAQAIPLAALVLAIASPAAAARAAKSGEMDSAEIQALNLTESKLAALAKEANAPGVPAATPGRNAKKSADPPKLASAQSPAGPQHITVIPATAGQDSATPVPQKAAGKKRLRLVRRTRLAKVRLAKGAKADLDPKAAHVVDRRLTRAEVLAILSTTRDFSGSDLSGMNLVGIDFSGVKFNRANLHLANLERADLAETDLELADLSGADLRGASLNQARLRGTLLNDTRMDGALWIDRMVCKKGSVGDCLE